MKFTSYLNQFNYMENVISLKSKLTIEFIDYCNENNIDLVQWYRWQLHLLWERRKISRILN